jgi:bifunctional DNA-binding transcriptional regulator/antitoxin component of YhaV-PrlF toxin-antitoxin module
MKSVITSKFQTTIPKAVRDRMKLSVQDTLEWRIIDGKAVVAPMKKAFLGYQNCIKIGEGDISKDIELARRRRAESSQ